MSIDQRAEPHDPLGAATDEATIAESIMACPDLLGLSAQDARRVVRQADLLTELEEHAAPEHLWGHVLAQVPEPGATLEAGDIVSVTVGARPQVLVPDIRGGSEFDALSALREAGLVPSRRAVRQSDQVPEGAIVKTRPRHGASVPIGSRVAYVVAAAPRRHEAKRRRDPGPIRIRRLPDGTFLSMPGRD